MPKSQRDTDAKSRIADKRDNLRRILYSWIIGYYFHCITSHVITSPPVWVWRAKYTPNFLNVTSGRGSSSCDGNSSAISRTSKHQSSVGVPYDSHWSKAGTWQPCHGSGPITAQWAWSRDCFRPMRVVRNRHDWCFDVLLIPLLTML